MSAEQDALVAYRLEQAEEALVDAELLAGVGHWNSCVNRLYYASFYAVSALFARHNLSASKHTGMRALFNRHFVRSGAVPRELGRLYNELFDNRQRGDYAAFSRFEEDEGRLWLGEARQFVAFIRATLADPDAPAPGGSPPDA